MEHRELILLQLQFALPISFREITRFRGAFVEMNKRKNDIFHNHKSDRSYHHRYPRIQYQQLDGSAAILALEEGVAALQEAIRESNEKIRWKNRPTQLELQQVNLHSHRLDCSTEMVYNYQLKNYLPFNDNMFKIWKTTDNIYQKAELLTKLIAGHLIAFAKGIDWKIPARFEVEIIDITRQQPLHLHGLKRPAFDISFRTHLSLPSGIGLGKGVSHGFGRLSSI